MIFFPQALTASSLLPHFLLLSCYHHLLHPILPTSCPGIGKRSVQKLQTLGKARGVATRMGMKEKGTVHAPSVGTELSSHVAHSPLQTMLQTAAGDMGEAETQSLQSHEEKKLCIQSKDEA